MRKIKRFLNKNLISKLIPLYSVKKGGTRNERGRNYKKNNIVAGNNCGSGDFTDYIYIYKRLYRMPYGR